MATPPVVAASCSASKTKDATSPADLVWDVPTQDVPRSSRCPLSCAAFSCATASGDAAVADAVLAMMAAGGAAASGGMRSGDLDLDLDLEDLVRPADFWRLAVLDADLERWP